MTAELWTGPALLACTIIAALLVREAVEWWRSYRPVEDPAVEWARRSLAVARERGGGLVGGVELWPIGARWIVRWPGESHVEIVSASSAEQSLAELHRRRQRDALEEAE